MNTIADPDLQAGEYVLGVLEAAERAAAETRATEDAEFAAAIRLWQRRLGPLHELIVPVAAPEAVWPRVAARLDHFPQSPRTRRSFARTVAELAESAGADASLVLAQRLRRWRAIAILAGAVAISLAGFLLAEALRVPASSQRLVGLLQAESTTPPVSMALDLRARALIVRPAVPLPPDKVYEYWMVVGEPPTAFLLGRAREEAVFQASVLQRLGRNQLVAATIGVTIEARDRPSFSEPGGPFVLTGKLLVEGSER
jgi:anti-sigma-K factor RskA